MFNLGLYEIVGESMAAERTWHGNHVGSTEFAERWQDQAEDWLGAVWAALNQQRPLESLDGQTE